MGTKKTLPHKEDSTASVKHQDRTKLFHISKLLVRPRAGLNPTHAKSQVKVLSKLNPFEVELRLKWNSWKNRVPCQVWVLQDRSKALDTASHWLCSIFLYDQLSGS